MSAELQPITDLIHLGQQLFVRVHREWLPIHSQLASNQRLIKRGSWLLILAILLLIPLALVVRQLQLGYPGMYALGAKLGSTAVLVYLLSLVPGIFKRLGWVFAPALSLMLFRRQIGAVMYILAFTHFVLVQLIPSNFVFNPAVLMDKRLLGGMMALSVAGVLFVTSNDWSMRLLHHGWQKLHRITYALIFFLLIHVGLQELKLGLLLLVFAGLESWSWWRHWQRPQPRPVQ